MIISVKYWYVMSGQVMYKLSLIPLSQPTLKRLATATGAVDYNILQNNGTIAHQQVHHVSLMISSPNCVWK